MNQRILHLALLLGGAAVLGAAFASHPATARGVQPDVCTSSSACVDGTNTAAGPGVSGTAVANHAVIGYTKTPSSAGGRSGVNAYNNYTNGVGIYATSTNGVALQGTTVDGTGVLAQGISSQAEGLYVESDSTNNPAVYAYGGSSLIPTMVIVGGTSSGTGGLMDLIGTVNGALLVNDQSNAFFHGLVYTAGPCSGGCDEPRGRRMLSSAPRSARPTMEDVGEGRLHNGSAQIRFDPSFANVIDEGAGYSVLLSAEGPTSGDLFVSRKSAAGFDVAEAGAGRSNAPFAYRIIAHPYGVSATTLRAPQTSRPATSSAGTGRPSRVPRIEATRREMLQPDTNCSSPGPCVAGRNAGTGYGMSASSTKHALKGTVTGGSGFAGVYGQDNSTDGGTADSGVTGESNKYRGIDAAAFGQPAIVGTSQTGTGVLAISTPCFGCSFAPALTAYAPNTSAATIVVQGGDSNDTSGTALDAEHSDTTPAFVVDNAGNVHVYGQVYTGGGCSGGCARAGYAVPRSSVPTMEDSGSARLANGQAIVRFDQAWKRTIDPSAGYVVFVSAEGETRGLYVTDRTPEGFAVHENTGGRSNLPFSYRVVATPYGAHLARLPMIHVAHGPAVDVPAGRRRPRVRY
jgi:hypothetical protein